MYCIYKVKTLYMHIIQSSAFYKHVHVYDIKPFGFIRWFSIPEISIQQCKLLCNHKDSHAVNLNNSIFIYVSLFVH